MKKYISNSMFLLLLVFTQSLFAQTKVTIEDPATWRASELAKYQGQTITFTTPFYVCNNYNGLKISPRRTMTPTNQVFPGTADYREYLQLNSTGEVYLNGVSGYHRLGERIENLTVKVSSTSTLQAVGTPKFVGNTRADLEKGYPSVDMVGEHTLLVCALNLEYYLVDNLGTGYGPDNTQQAAKQHAKIMDALKHIRADIFGFVEIEQGQSALRKLANALTSATGRKYSYIDDGGSSSGSYTKSGYVYCTETVEPYGDIRSNNAEVRNRKKMQAFVEKSSGGKFIFSLNHFKAKSGSGTGDNADQDDGQGVFNATRVREAKSVLTEINTSISYFKDPDVLVMGDLNAYAKEDPITTLIDGGLTDMYRYFHADSAYSYVFRGQAGYLDHALANASMMQQVTGMQPYHINSDESDEYTYDKSSDQTMFRCSDHDPVLVGLALTQTSDVSNSILDNSKAYASEGKLVIETPVNSYYRVYDLMGNLLITGEMLHAYETVDVPHANGFYVVQLYVKASETFLQVKTVKVRM